MEISIIFLKPKKSRGQLDPDPCGSFMCFQMCFQEEEDFKPCFF